MLCPRVMLRLESLLPLFATVLMAPACGTKSGECENTLMLSTTDTGTTHAIDDGCTSLVVSLTNDPAVSLDGVPTVDATVLRFDYRIAGTDTTDYYFTPLRSGTTDVQIGAQPATSAWTATLRITLPD